MIRKALYLFLASTVILFVAYYFQPGRKDKVHSASTGYELASNWLHLPANFRLGNPTGLGIDTNGNLVVFHRAGREWSLLGPMPDNPIQNNTITIIDKNSGRLLHSWGSNQFVMPHGLTVDTRNNIWITDVGLHQVFKFSYDGKLLLRIGEAKVAGDDRHHFNKPTDVAVANDGSFYVSDGYGNSRVIKFSSNGNYMFEWGKKGRRQGEFNVPHSLSLDTHGNVYVADRENNRVQKFDSTGKFIHAWKDKSFGAITAVFFDRRDAQLVAADDHRFLQIKHRGSDIIIFDTAGTVQARWGRSGSYTGATCWYHDLVVDNERNIYVGDILGNTIQKFRKIPAR